MYYIYFLFSITFGISIYFLTFQYKYIIFYIIGSLFCILTNIILKILIKEPHLQEDKVLFNILLNNDKHIDFFKYGMPSGFSQFLFFTVTYLYFIKKKEIKKNYIIFLLLFLFYYFNEKKSSNIQIFIGVFFGFVIGYFIFFLTNQYINSLLKNKKDDNVLIYSNPL
jgi:hypothetical protein